MKRLFAIIFALSFCFATEVFAETTTYSNCGWERPASPVALTCSSIGKTEAYHQNCQGLPKPTPYGENANIPCCCKAETEYSCQWQTLSAQVIGEDGLQIKDTCDGLTTEGTDCDPSKKPSSNGPDSKCCCPDLSSFKYTSAAWTIPELSIPINTVRFSEATCDDPENPTQCKIPWISQYIDGIYRYGLGIGGILAAIMLMAGGVMWLVSAGDASRITQAKSLIIGSVTGLVILVGTYTLLRQINPDLIKLQGVTLKMIERIEIESLPNGSDSEINESGNCADENKLIEIKQIVSTSASTPQLNDVGFGGLKKAVNEAKKYGKELHVTSAYRTASHQKQLWDNAVQKYGDESVAAKYVARPGSCGGHRSGQTIDVCIKGTPSCSKMNGANAQATNEDIALLQKIMQAAGWKRYCGEWWHYQYQNNPGQSCSP